MISKEQIPCNFKNILSNCFLVTMFSVGNVHLEQGLTIFFWYLILLFKIVMPAIASNMITIFRVLLKPILSFMKKV